MLRNPIFKFFASLKLAVFSILSLAAVLAVATIVESMYGMRASHVMVYGTWWFMGVLLLLGVNVLCAALSRYPWKRRQLGFVITHGGILTLLFGALLTQRFGVDGNLPVVQGDKENQVILNDFQLVISDEEGKQRAVIPVPESGRESSGKLLRIDFPGALSLTVDRFFPRSLVQEKVIPSPSGIGTPSLHIELFNSRFRVQEWLFSALPDKATELSLGPAVLSFRKLWSAADEKAFLQNPNPLPKDRRDAASDGFLVVTYEGREYRVNIERALGKWVKIQGTSLELKVNEYLPYAIVENNRLVNKSKEPVNPAVNLTVRASDVGEEQHTVFANFPEFATLHAGHRSKHQPLGLKIKMLGPNSEHQSLAIVGNNRGRLQFAQSADDSKLFYFIQNASGVVTGKGVVTGDTPIPTGWMDLRFRVVQWEPVGLAEEVPRYVDLIEGQAENNFLSALHLTKNDAQKSDSGMWLTEGTAKRITLGAHRVEAYYGRERMALPFYLFLDKFTMGTDPGTNKAATYESDVSVKDPNSGKETKAKISMNEPLVYGGYTFYQASYQMDEGQAPISVFAVNYDPGRRVKYIGALLMVFGILLMFYLNPSYLDKLLKPKRSVA